MSVTGGTGRRGNELWKLYSIGLGPENNFTSTCSDNRHQTSGMKTKQHGIKPINKLWRTNTVHSFSRYTLQVTVLQQQGHSNAQTFSEDTKMFLKKLLVRHSFLLTLAKWTHQPNFGTYGHGPMAIVHPAMPGQQRFQDVPHDKDDSDPNPCTNQHSTNDMLGVLRYVLTAEKQSCLQRWPLHNFRHAGDDRPFQTATSEKALTPFKFT